jgi:tight adherence protein C
MLTFAALISMPLLTKIAMFGGVACGAWLLLDLISKTKPRAEARLDDFRDPSRRRADGRDGSRGVTKRSDGMARLLERASPRMARPLQPKSEADVGKLRAKLNYAGFRTEAAPSIFLGLKTI